MTGTSTACCIAGGGPAGMMLGLLLARQGVDVVVLEKHADFFRDFRGDTVHPSTLNILAEIGLAEAFLEVPHQEVAKLGVATDDGSYAFADFARLPGAFPFIVFMPQWDFLTFLAEQARAYPCFQLRMGTEATGLIREDGAVRGVRYRTGDGVDGEIRARLTVAADGRHSTLRGAADLRPREFGAPMDVLWFRLPKVPEDDGPSFGGLGKLTRGRMLVLIDRGDYWQTAYLVPKGGFDAVRAAGMESFRADLDRLLPGMKAAVAGLRDWSDVSVLSVQLNRLARWHLPGLLLIRDAAHAMSPIGGVGINLAVQDAVAAARLLGETFAGGGPNPAALARVRSRRLLPTAVIQLVQRQIQQRFLTRILAGDQPVSTPRLLRLLQRLPALQGVTARVVGLGILPEHAGLPSEVRHQGLGPRTG